MIGDYIAFLSSFRVFIINFAENIRIKLIFNSNYYNKNQKMKKFFSYFMISLCLLGTSVVTSCSSDDDDKEESLPELKYKSDAAIYQLEDNAEEIEYVELTTSGNYIIQYNGMAPNSSVSMKDFECGTFTKNSEDNTYLLEGKTTEGETTTLKVEQVGGEYNVTLGGKTYTAVKVGSIASFTNTNQLEQICRSWSVKKVYANINSTVFKSTEVSASNYKDLLNKLGEEYTLPYFVELDNISFSNTYKFKDRLSYVSINKKGQKIRRGVWQWNTNAIVFDESGEDVNVAFEGTTMKFKHTTVDGSTTIEWGYEFTPAPLSVR